MAAAAGVGDAAQTASKPAAPGAGPESVSEVDPATIDGGRQEATDAGGGNTAQAPPAAATTGTRAAELTPGGTAADAEATPVVTVEQPPTGQSRDGGGSPGVQATDPVLTGEAADTGSEPLELAAPKARRERSPSPPVEARVELAAGGIGRTHLPAPAPEDVVRSQAVAVGASSSSGAIAGAGVEISRLKDKLRSQKAETELARRNHAKLGSQRQESTALLRRLAEVGNESLAKLGVAPTTIDGSDVSTLTPFFAEFVGRLTAVEDRIRSFGDRQVSVAASQVAAAILLRVHQAYPDFPFETIFNDWSPEENKEEHANAVSHFVDEMVVRMTGQAGAGDDEEEAAAEEAPAAESAAPEAPPLLASHGKKVVTKPKAEKKEKAKRYKDVPPPTTEEIFVFYSSEDDVEGETRMKRKHRLQHIIRKHSHVLATEIRRGTKEAENTNMYFPAPKLGHFKIVRKDGGPHREEFNKKALKIIRDINYVDISSCCI
ncbi:uncharacterized protein LOC104585505 [Brachypodium distachyon]|uniref:uncharacterized protein LOC104585505 n=1 Tax=Brachypodium distachyon TaxID=15368 RepID=UPI00052FF022|nr:uncharacterized protein LOC104585505 [Brachypodium distachyon]|eukprot:XP_010240720.1 uncharacterized protein LOC104585505 [Brachypodium distachyon]